MTTDTTDPIAAARAVLENDLSIMLLCEKCPEECSCYPPADMWRRRDNGDLICEGCAETADMPVEDLHHAPRPDHVIRALLVALEAERARAGDAEAERDQALAWLAAAHREAIERCAALLIELGYVSESGETLANEVRGLRVDPDAQAALNKLLAEARLKGWRAGRDDAAEVAVSRYEAWSDEAWSDPDSCPVVCDVTACADVAAAIRALPEPKEASHG